MTQISICSFVNITNVFNLEEGCRVTSHINIPRTSKQVKQIRRPRLLTFTSEKNIELERISQNEFDYCDTKYMAILKSNLQKAIRRNLPNTAMVTATKLFQIDGGSVLVLRRLCIIIVEDKLKDLDKILDAYKFLTWIMATEYAPSGWRSWVLGLIETICGFGHLPLPHDENINIWYDNSYSNYFNIRSYFGGMKGDMRLLQNVARLVDKKSMTNTLEVTIPRKKIKIINEVSILRGAVDFHCMPNMLNNIQAKHDKYTTDEIKSAIWRHSSSLRYGIERATEDQIWKDIKRSVRIYQKYITQNLSS